jgi:hypothetical protein
MEARISFTSSVTVNFSGNNLHRGIMYVSKKAMELIHTWTKYRFQHLIHSEQKYAENDLMWVAI